MVGSLPRRGDGTDSMMNVATNNQLPSPLVTALRGATLLSDAPDGASAAKRQEDQGQEVCDLRGDVLS